MSKSVIADLRREYHCRIFSNILGHRQGTTVYSIADKSSPVSCEIARLLVSKIGLKTCKEPKSGQTAGSRFTQYTLEFLKAAFCRLGHLRPGEWVFSAGQGGSGIAHYDQYEHLAALEKVLHDFRELKAALGGDYLVIPDIVVARKPVNDEEINAREVLLKKADDISACTPLRANNFEHALDILHASISCKWTMRSDRAQNTRTEALNLIRNRKGKTPHIVAVTFEPLPSRLSSIALGTGDVDCTYHAALKELTEAVDESGNETQKEMLDTLVNGRRLRDISDLPFDLAT